ncbi:cadherin-like domain-containing protein, partial [Methylomonas koyamae]
GQTLNIAAPGMLANDSDADGDALQVQSIDITGTQGVVTAFADGHFSFTPTAGFSGDTSFKYTLIDGFGGSALGIVTVSVTNTAPVTGNDSYSVQAGQTLNIAAPGLLVNDSDADGDALQLQSIDITGTQGVVTAFPDGHFSFTSNNGFTGQTSFSYTVRDGFGGSAQGTVTIDVTAAASLKVVSFVQTDSGFAVRFNRALDVSVLNLYTGEPSNMGAADLVLTGPDGKPVAGSLLLDSDHAGFSFLRTGGVLAAGNYNLTLASRIDGFKGFDGLLLDGNADGTAGDNYLKLFTVANANTAVLSVGEIARGPGQSLANPATNFNFPITLENAAGATSLAFTLNYNPALLTVNGFSGGNLPAGSQVVTDTTVAGQLRVTINAAVALPAGKLILGNLEATVPTAAVYGAKDMLRLSDVSLDGGARQLKTDDGLHVVAFIGDVTGDANYTTLDFQRMNRVLLRQDSGFGAWPLVDPLIVGDVNPNGKLQSADALKLAYQIGGTPQKDIPPIPAGLPPLVFAGADPKVSLGTVSAIAGSRVSVPVTIDTTAGLESIQMTVRYDAQKLSLVEVQKTALTAGFVYTVVQNNPGELRIDASALKPLADGNGVLFELNFAVAASARGSAALDFVSVRLNDTWLTVDPLPVAGADPTDGLIEIAAPARHPTLALRQGVRSFDLGKSGQQPWLSEWLNPSEKDTAKANDWSISAKRPIKSKLH